MNLANPKDACMPEHKSSFEFLVEDTDQGWMVYGGWEPLGPFFTKEQAMDLATGMATALQAVGDTVVVRAKD
jgi:hypothetical protein